MQNFRVTNSTLEPMLLLLQIKYPVFISLLPHDLTPAAAADDDDDDDEKYDARRLTGSRRGGTLSRKKYIYQTTLT